MKTKVMDTTKSVKEAVKAVNEKEKRSKNLIIYGVTESEVMDPNNSQEIILRKSKDSNKVKSICEEIDLANTRFDSSCRIGTIKLNLLIRN